MPKTKPKKANRDYNAVSFDRGFLKAAIGASGRSEADIAQCVGVRQQNIAYMLSNKSAGTCGQSLREALARELSIPEQLLTGKKGSG
ncbi:MAG: hypothetical protein M3R65_05360 [Gemmatimonadota bacterium]|nr:hypothetical protein [Gemmatimonadota bacterium]